MTLDEALAELAEASPRAFTSVRRALATRLREAGQSKIAKEILAQRAPTLPLWAVNRLAVEAPRDVEALIAAAERVRAAQLGRGHAGGVGSASADFRAALERLMERARAVVTRAGARATPEVLRRVQTSLGAAAADPSYGAALRRGRLQGELGPLGFDAFAGARAAPARSRPDTASRQRPAVRSEPGPSSTPPASAADTEARRADRGDGAREKVMAARARREADARREEEERRRRERIEQAGAALSAARERADAAETQVSTARARLRELMAQVKGAKEALSARTAEARRAARAAAAAERSLAASRSTARPRGGQARGAAIR